MDCDLSSQFLWAQANIVQPVAARYELCEAQSMAISLNLSKQIEPQHNAEKDWQIERETVREIFKNVLEFDVNTIVKLILSEKTSLVGVSLF